MLARIALAIAAIAALPAAGFFRPGDFQHTASPADVSIGHDYQCHVAITFTEARPDLVQLAYTDQPACTAADALAMRYALAAAYCSYGDGSGADNARCAAGIAPAAAEDPGFFAKAGGTCEVDIRFDAARPKGLEIHWPGGCARAPVLLAVRYALTATLCARTTHCPTGPAIADPDPNPKEYAPRAPRSSSDAKLR
jgi:hypothetical protein